MQTKVIWFVVPFVLCPAEVFAAGAGEGQPTASEVIRGVVARSEAFFSARMKYHLRQGFPGDKPDENDFRLLCSGPSWRLEYRIDVSKSPYHQADGKKLDPSPLKGFYESTSLSHRGKSVTYGRTPQLDGSIRHAARIAAEMPVKHTTPYPPVFAGTFWYDCTKQFVEKNTEKAVRKAAPSDVNGIAVHVLEWAVPEPEKYKAFHGTNDLTSKGGALRLYVAPQLGYALPRIEYVGRNGKVAASFDSWDFEEHTGGLFLPKRCKMQYYTDKGPGYYLEYEILELKDVNQSIPDSEFVVQLPVGTEVADSRGKGSIFFVINEKDPIPTDFQDVIAKAQPPFWGRNWHTALIVGVGAAVVVLGLGYFVRRRLSLRKKQP